MLKPFLTVIVVCYKSNKYLPKCISSLKKAAKRANLSSEIILVINDRQKRKYYHIQGVKKINYDTNLGYARGINEGAKKAWGKWLLIANPDTVTNLNALVKLRKYLKDKKIAVIGPKIINPGNNLQLTINYDPSLWNVFLEQSYLYKLYPLLPGSKANPILYSCAGKVEAIEGTYFLIRRDIFDKIGRMDERFFLYYEDMDICKRIRNAGFNVIFEPESKIIHFQSKSSEGITVTDQYVKSLKKYFLKYHSKLYTESVLILLLTGSFFRKYFWEFKYKLIDDYKQKAKTVQKRKYYEQLLLESYKSLTKL